MKPSHGKRRYGISKERSLVNFFWRNKIPAIRSPASGAAASTPRPDVIVFSYGKILCLECKYSRDNRAYYRWSDWYRTYEFSKALKEKGFHSEAYLVFSPSGRERSIWIKLTEEMYQKKAKITLYRDRGCWRYLISFEEEN